MAKEQAIEKMNYVEVTIERDGRKLRDKEGFSTLLWSAWLSRLGVNKKGEKGRLYYFKEGDYPDRLTSTDEGEEPSNELLEECVVIGSEYVCSDYESAREGYKRGRLSLSPKPFTANRESVVDKIDLVGSTICYALCAFRDELIEREVLDCYRDTFASEILSLIEPKVQEGVKNMDEFYKKYLPDDDKKYPVTMRVSKEEEEYLRWKRGEATIDKRGEE